MKFKYVGKGKDSPVETVVFGYAFTLNGPAVEVTDDKAVKKLLGNMTFASTVKDAVQVNKTEDSKPADDTSDEKTSDGPTLEEMKAALKAAGINLRGLTAAKVADKYKGLTA